MHLKDRFVQMTKKEHFTQRRGVVKKTINQSEREVLREMIS